MERDKLVELRRRLTKKGIRNVRLTIESPTATTADPNFPIQRSSHTGEIVLTLSFEVRPDDMRAIDHALTILKELKENQ